MTYIVDFCVISLLYLVITTIFFFKRTKISTNQNICFSLLLIVGLVSLVFDIIAAVINEFREFPIFLTYIINIIFLVGVQLNGPLILFYTLIITGFFSKTKKWHRVVLLVPFFFACLCIFISPFTNQGVFYITSDNSYYPGKIHLIIYIVVILYMMTSLTISIIKFRKIQKRKVFSIFTFMAVSVIAMLIQMLSDGLLVNSMGNALALTIMYHAVQIPDENIDSLTRLLNNKSLKIVLRDLSEQNQDFTIKLFTLNCFHVVNQEHGIKYGDELMIVFAKYLQKRYPKAFILRLIGDIYSVIEFNHPTALNEETIKAEHEQIPNKWSVLETLITMNISLIGMNSQDFSSLDELKNVINFFISRHEKNEDIPYLFVNDKYREECSYSYKVQGVLEKAIHDKTIDVYYQPIHNKEGKLVAFEALCRLIDKDLGFISPDLFIDIAEQNGSIHELGAIVLDKVCQFIVNNDLAKWQFHHIGVNLSFLQCTDINIHQKLMKIISKYNIPQKLISFEITETSSNASINLVKENMCSFISDGIHFMLDDFGSGYANYNYILELPFKCVKIDKMILWQAMKTNKDFIYLKTLVDALNKLNLATICEGVETKEQADLLTKLGVTMQQGYLYSKALPENETIKYINNQLS